MKRTLFFSVLAVVCICIFSSFTKGGKDPKKETPTGVYIFGFSASFKDSTVYFTEIQPIDGISLEKKTKFLPHCSEYSSQLKTFLETQRGEDHRVCATYSEEKKQDIEKLYVKLKKFYSSQKNLKVIFLNETEFKYTKYEEKTEEQESEE
ncbi:MAG: hypothetical protein MJZ83_10525 [Bacteroidaceae bacterium]|nr:hypothetical protein [Bacteroidaceae bacterium]